MMMATTTDEGGPDLSSLSEEERKKLSAVLQRAKEFEASEEKLLMRQPLEGSLYKYTNVVKGWQYRWFVLEPESGLLSYYEKEEQKKTQRARAIAHLAGAVISPSDEDSQTFTVNLANGEGYKLKAVDAKERQHWVNRLRATAEYHTDNIALNAPPIPRESRPSLLQQLHPTSASSTSVNKTDVTGSNDSLSTTSTAPANKSSTSVNQAGSKPLPQPANQTPKKSKDERSSVVVIKRSQHRQSAVSNHSASHHQPSSMTPSHNSSLNSAREIVSEAQEHCEDLTAKIENLPSNGEEITALDKEMLLLKATSAATLACLEQCLTILHQQQSAASQAVFGNNIEWLEPKRELNYSQQRNVAAPVSPAESFVSTSSQPGHDLNSTSTDVSINHADEVEDEKEYTDTDLGGVEEHKSVILHLLSQLKLGMDLTKVVLPTFILERRSLLEMFADCMAHPDIFLQIAEKPDAESRMLAVIEWYLTSFHVGRKGSIAKKPYNPIIGETFHCSWSVPKSQSSSGELGQGKRSEDSAMYYCAEQVSHHPPISAFYIECPDKHMSLSASIWTKSKFMGMSIGVVMVGKVRLQLLDAAEEYEFSLPSAYARSILTVPWVELGDRININCPSTGYAANVTFHTKPFYGGKLHKVSSEVKKPSGDVVCRVAGEWNGELEFTYADERTKVIDTSKLPVTRKRVRPLHLQGEFESRRLWNSVTENLTKGDYEAATQHKRFLEERQRQGERHRKETNTQFPTKFFHKAGDTWVYNNPLSAPVKKAQCQDMIYTS